mmetsp:Transcript_29073/g.69253  ORF Transcript_29073/g.69253 Transcript_29073/m.69253 type:complete len:312 (-) Transcript_29073:73-1008(-)
MRHTGGPADLGCQLLDCVLISHGKLRNRRANACQSSAHRYSTACRRCRRARGCCAGTARRSHACAFGAPEHVILILLLNRGHRRRRWSLLRHRFWHLCLQLLRLRCLLPSHSLQQLLLVHRWRCRIEPYTWFARLAPFAPNLLVLFLRLLLHLLSSFLCLRCRPRVETFVFLHRFCFALAFGTFLVPLLTETLSLGRRPWVESFVCWLDTLGPLLALSLAFAFGATGSFPFSCWARCGWTLSQHRLQLVLRAVASLLRLVIHQREEGFLAEAFAGVARIVIAQFCEDLAPVFRVAVEVRAAPGECPKLLTA